MVSDAKMVVPDAETVVSDAKTVVSEPKRSFRRQNERFRRRRAEWVRKRRGTKISVNACLGGAVSSLAVNFAAQGLTFTCSLAGRQCNGSRAASTSTRGTGNIPLLPLRAKFKYQFQFFFQNFSTFFEVLLIDRIRIDRR